jgi:hypothetical protein
LIAVPGSENRDFSSFDLSLCESEEWASYGQAAGEALTRLENGEAFEDLAAELSGDVGTADRGGFLGESDDVDRIYIPEFAAAIHDAEIGEYYGPVCSVFGFHILQVLDKYWRDHSQLELQGQSGEAYQEWTFELLSNATIERDGDWLEWVIGEPTLEDMLGDIFEFDGNSIRR